MQVLAWNGGVCIFFNVPHESRERDWRGRSCRRHCREYATTAGHVGANPGTHLSLSEKVGVGVKLCMMP